MGIKIIGGPRLPVIQKYGSYSLNSPLVLSKDVVPTIMQFLKSQKTPGHIFTIDFSLRRFSSELQKMGLSSTRLDLLLKDNLDHHDGLNPGMTATEVVFKSIHKFRGTNNLIISDQVIDADNVCATFAALNPKMARDHQKTLAEVARYGDYFDKISDGATKIALTIDAMRFGKNRFNLPFFKLTPEQQGELFNDILSQMPEMLTNIPRFADHYEGELAKLNGWRKRTRNEGLIKSASKNVDVIDVDGFPRSVAYQESDKAIVISMKALGGGRFTYNPVGANPRIANLDLKGLWERLRDLENSEREKRGTRRLEPSESWGGREVAGGSAKDENIGSVLTLEQVTQEIENYLRETSQLPK